MFPACTTQAGMATAMPDTCLTPAPPSPPIPTPYPNMAQLAMALSTSTTVTFGNRFVVTEGSKIPSTNGDEAGANGGVVSGMIMGEAAPRLFSSKVFVQGKKVAYLTSMTAHNGSNANAPAGLVAVPSQTVVFVAP